MGRTVRTFTLLPGESTTIRIKTWQSSRSSIKESSSIIDSHDQSARDRFSSKIQNESTDKKTRASNESWSLEAKAKASWGWGGASLKGSSSGEYQAGREQFSRQLADAVNEHSREASAKRELSVTSSSETIDETGFESVTERLITNVNMRRVLSFVFRELNQEYRTRIHLVGISVAFTNGRADTWREVPISGLRMLLEDYVAAPKREEVGTAILQVARTVIGSDSSPVTCLQSVEYDPASDTVTTGFVSPGPLELPTEERWYRFAPGPLGQEGTVDMVDGVLLSETAIVMRTDSVIVEAVLGGSDALDSYAMELQEAAAQRETLENERERLFQETLREVSDPERRATLAAALYGSKPKVASNREPEDDGGR